MVSVFMGNITNKNNYLGCFICDIISISALPSQVTWEVTPATKIPVHEFVSYFKIILPVNLGFAVIPFPMSEFWLSMHNYVF